MEPIKIIDTVSPWLRSVLAEYPNWERKALKSTANYARSEIKKGIKSGSPGGMAYKPLARGGLLGRDLVGSRSGHVSMTKRGQRHSNRRAKVILGSLASAVRYNYAGGAVEIGWLAEWAKIFGSRMEGGATEGVTRGMRGLYGKGAEGLRASTSAINIPARPTFDPMYAYLSSRLGPYFESKIMFYLENGVPDKNSGKG